MGLERLTGAGPGASKGWAHLSCSTSGQGTAAGMARNALHVRTGQSKAQAEACSSPASSRLPARWWCRAGRLPAKCHAGSSTQLSDRAGSPTQGTLSYRPWLTCSAWKTVASAATIPNPMASLASLGASSEMKPRQMRKKGRLLNSPPCWSALRCRTLAITPIVLASRGEPPPWAATGQEDFETAVSVNLCS